MNDSNILLSSNVKLVSVKEYYDQTGSSSDRSNPTNNSSFNESVWVETQWQEQHIWYK